MTKTREEKNAYGREYYWKHKEKQNAYSKKYYWEHRDKERNQQAKYHRGYILMRSYGISLEEYDEMFKEQKGCCAICGRHQSELNHKLHVDHNHSTGKVRALLCKSCNRMVGEVELGYFDGALAYLEKYQ